MKKFTVIMIALLAMTAGTKAATDYGFYVAGVKVTSSNCDNITNSTAGVLTIGTNGHLYYAPAKKTLYVKNVTIKRTGSGNYGLKNEGCAELIVIFEGENYFYSEDNSAIYVKKNTYLQCDNGGYIKLHSKNNDAVTANNNSTITFNHAKVDVVSDHNSKYGLMSDENDTRGSFKIQNSTVQVTTKNSAIYKINQLIINGSSHITLNGNNSDVTVNNVKSFILDEDMEISSPTGAYFDSSKKAICTSSAASGYKGTIKIETNAISINSTNFPNATFKSYVSAVADEDLDGYLTKYERSAIKEIDVSNKSINNLKGVEFFTSLSKLTCSYNKLNTLDVSKNTALTTLSCDNNNLTSLNLMSNTNLQVLFCEQNKLTSISLPSTSKLTTLSCYNNKITGSNMTNLINKLPQNNSGNNYLFIPIFNNDFTYNVANNIDYSSEGNECTPEQVKLVSAKKWKTQVALSNRSASDYAGGYLLNSTRFPDATFLAEMKKKDLSINGILEVSEAEAITQLYVQEKNISTLKGVEYLTNLETLNCGNNNLTSLDVSKNTKLEDLICYSNQLTSLDVSKLSKLTWLPINLNQIKGTAMTNLMKSLPSGTVNGEQRTIMVYEIDDSEGNVCTSSDVSIAKGKGWKVLVEKGNIRTEYSSIATDIKNVTPSADDPTDNTPRYNLNGQRIGANYRGIVVVNGRKVLTK